MNQDAAAGVQVDNDPVPSNPDWYEYTTNWAGDYSNMVVAYQEWMYDDGPNSPNVDCAPSTPDGCWIHRHDILWRFDGNGPLAMGAAAGVDPSGAFGFATLLEQLNPTSRPTYTYTWAQAVADGASSYGEPASNPPPAASGPPIAHVASVGTERVHVRGHRVVVLIADASALGPRCSLRLSRVRRGLTDRKRCAGEVSFSRVPAGRYRLIVRTSAGARTVRVVVR
jgi:hypothetical protein